MKFTKLFAASMAVLTLASCSKDMVETPDSGLPNLKPGDALITFNLSGKTSSYATDAQEKAIENKQYKLYAADGTEIPTTDNTSTDNNKLTLVVDATEMENHWGTNMNLVVVANAADVALPNAYSGVAALTVSKTLDLAATGGLPAAVDVPINMTRDGVKHEVDANNKANQLRRAVSRIYVQKGANASGSINGARVTITGTNNAARLFGTDYTGAATTLSYTQEVKGETAQPIAYVYPSPVGVQVNVVLGNSNRTIILKNPLLHNSNYALTITPLPSTNGEIDFDLSFEDWGDGDDFDLDFNDPQTLKPDGTLQGSLVDYTLESGKLISPVFGSLNPTGNSVAEISVPVTDLFNVKEGTTLTFTGATLAAAAGRSGDGSISADGQFKVWVDGGNLKFKLIPNYNTSDNKEYQTQLTLTSNSSSDTYTEVVTFVSKPVYDKDFFYDVDGVSLTTLMLGKPKDDSADDKSKIAFVNGVLEEIRPNSTETVTQEMMRTFLIAKLNISYNEYAKYVQGGDKAGAISCPYGSRIPTTEELYKILGFKDELYAGITSPATIWFSALGYPYDSNFYGDDFADENDWTSYAGALKDNHKMFLEVNGGVTSYTIKDNNGTRIAVFGSNANNLKLQSWWGVGNRNLNFAFVNNLGFGTTATDSGSPTQIRCVKDFTNTYDVAKAALAQ